MTYGNWKLAESPYEDVRTEATFADMQYLIKNDQREESERYSAAGDDGKRPARKFDVRHTACGEEVHYMEDPDDPDIGQFVCSDFRCDSEWERQEIDRRWHTVEKEFSLHLPAPDKVVYRLHWDYYTGKTAFSYMKEATNEEVKETLLTELEARRQKLQRS